MRLENLLVMALYYGDEKRGEIVFEIPANGNFSLKTEDLQEVPITITEEDAIVVRDWNGNFPIKNCSRTLCQILHGKNKKRFPILINGEIVLRNVRETLSVWEEIPSDRDSERFQVVRKVQATLLQIL